MAPIVDIQVRGAEAAQDPLAEKILGGEIPDSSTVRIDEGDGELKMAVG